MGVHRELVLLLAGDAIFLCDVLTRDAHVIVVVNIPEPVMHHGVDNLRVAETISLACLGQKIWSIRHRFHPARDDNGTVPGLHRLRCKSDRFQS